MAFDPDAARAGRIDDHLAAALGAIGLPVPALAAIGYGVVVGQQTIEVFGFKLSTETAATATCAVIAALLFHAARCLVAIAALLDQLANPEPALFRLRTHPSAFNPFLAVGGKPWIGLDHAGVALIGFLLGIVGSLQMLIIALSGGAVWLLPMLWSSHAALLAANTAAALSAGVLFWALAQCLERVNRPDARSRIRICAIAACPPIACATAIYLWTVAVR